MSPEHRLPWKGSRVYRLLTCSLNADVDEYILTMNRETLTQYRITHCWINSLTYLTAVDQAPLLALYFHNGITTGIVLLTGKS